MSVFELARRNLRGVIKKYLFLFFEGNSARKTLLLTFLFVFALFYSE